jgi:hypothetical protein
VVATEQQQHSTSTLLSASTTPLHTQIRAHCETIGTIGTCQSLKQHCKEVRQRAVLVTIDIAAHNSCLRAATVPPNWQTSVPSWVQNATNTTLISAPSFWICHAPLHPFEVQRHINQDATYMCSLSMQQRQPETALRAGLHLDCARSAMRATSRCQSDAAAQCTHAICRVCRPCLGIWHRYQCCGR